MKIEAKARLQAAEWVPPLEGRNVINVLKSLGLNLADFYTSEDLSKNGMFPSPDFYCGILPAGESAAYKKARTAKIALITKQLTEKLGAPKRREGTDPYHKKGICTVWDVKPANSGPMGIVMVTLTPEGYLHAQYTKPTRPKKA